MENDIMPFSRREDAFGRAYRVVIALAKRICLSKAERGRNRGRAVPCSKGIVRTFSSRCEARKSARIIIKQAEVADRMAAAPGTKAYGGYTAKLALYARPTGRFEVGPGNFMPPPHVDSAVIRLDRAPLADPATGVELTPKRFCSSRLTSFSPKPIR